MLLFIAVLLSVTVTAQEWQTNYAEAVVFAKDQDKPIILVFSGSDWCAPCIKLDREIWQSEEFTKYAKQNYILYRADFPRKKINKLAEEVTLQNKTLAELFNPKGHFPFVVVLDNNEKILGQTAYKKVSPTEYISQLNLFLE